MIETFGTQKTKKETMKQLMSYECEWCGNMFNQYVCTVDGVSDQVMCRNCGNFIKTWDSGK